MKLSDIYLPDPGVVDAANCGICSAPMDVTRNCQGSTSWAGRMAGIERKYDHFKCPHIDEGWHKQAKAILQEATKTASTKHKMMLMEEADEIVEDHLGM